jgi:hypothetical protein
VFLRLDHVHLAVNTCVYHGARPADLHPKDGGGGGGGLERNKKIKEKKKGRGTYQRSGVLSCAYSFSCCFRTHNSNVVVIERVKHSDRLEGKRGGREVKLNKDVSFYCSFLFPSSFSFFFFFHPFFPRTYVTAASHTRHHNIGKFACLREHLRAAFFSDHTLEISHDGGERVWPDGRSYCTSDNK